MKKKTAKTATKTQTQPSSARKKHSIPTEHLQALSNLVLTKAFLGKEFLTWLWYISDEKVHVDIPLVDSNKKVRGVELWIDDRILLESDSAQKAESLFRFGDPAQSVEAAIALESDKTVKELKLGMTIPEHGEFTANLAFDQLSPRSLQLPISQASDEELAETSILSVRIQQTNIFIKALDGLFLMFLNERTDKNWEDQGLVRIKHWVAAKAKQSRKSALH